MLALAFFSFFPCRSRDLLFFSFSSRHRSFPGSSEPCAVVDGLDRGIVQKKGRRSGRKERENEHLVESEEYERDD